MTDDLEQGWLHRCTAVDVEVWLPTGAPCAKCGAPDPGDVTAADAGVTLSVAFDASITASVTTRTIGGVGLRYGVPGRTSRGMLKVKDPGCLTYAGHAQDDLTPDVLSRVILTEEHDRGKPRGVLAALEHSPDGSLTRVSFHAAEGEPGDAALREADPHRGTRRGLSFDIVGAIIDGDTIVAGNVVAFGQCAIPAFDDTRIDTVAAAATTPTERGNIMLSPEQAARLLELQGRIDAGETLSEAEQAEYDALQALNKVYNSGGDAPAADAATASSASTPAPAATAPVAVAASMPSVPGGAGANRPPATTKPAGSALRKMIRDVTAALAPSVRSAQSITAALTDVTHGDHTENIEPLAWSGELWSGLKYVPVFSDLFSTDSLTNWEGKGWRFTTTPELQDYAGDKAAIPSGTVVTEDSSYEAARMAVGVDVDRKFYDFPNEGFVNGLFERVRESWEVKLDAKVKAYMLANVVPGTRAVSVSTTNADATVEGPAGAFRPSDVGATITGAGIPAATTILSVTDSNTIELSANATATATVTATIGAQESSVLKAAARAALVLKNRRVGPASFIMLNDEDMFSLMDVAEDDVPAFLQLYNIEPGNFRSSPDVPQGKVMAGVSQAATVRVLPGSPIRVSAQNLANGGIDEAFFGYWAVEEHHTSGLATVVFNPA